MNVLKAPDSPTVANGHGPRGLSLVGMMGAGKTTVGQCVGNLIGRTFVDADWELERRTGKTITALFTEGEASFRRLESALLDELAGRTDVVLATGGGAILNPQNRERLCAHGYVVYLHAKPQQLWRRVRVQRGRPLLDVDDPLQRLTDLYTQRDPLYRECANMVVETAGTSPMKLAGFIVERIARVAGWGCELGNDRSRTTVAGSGP